MIDYEKIGYGKGLHWSFGAKERKREILKRDGFDLSWIHFTHLEKWYMKLGYEPVLHWNCKGFVPG